MDNDKNKIVIKPEKKPVRNPAAKELENFPPVTHKDRRQPRGGSKNLTKDYELYEDDFEYE